MALHPRLERPSLEPPPRRTSNGLVVGLVLAVMGAGFAVAMPIAMRTWTDAAHRTGEVSRVKSAEAPPAHEVAEPVQVPGDALDPIASPPPEAQGRAGVRETAPTRGEDPPDLRVPGRDQAGNDADAPTSRDGDPGERDEDTTGPYDEKAKRDEDEEKDDPSDPEGDKDPDDTEPSGRARDEEEEERMAPSADDDDTRGASSSGKAEGGAGASNDGDNSSGTGGHSNGSGGRNGG